MRIRLINLDRSQDRLAEFNASNGHLTNIDRMSAVDGEHQDIAALVGNGTIDQGIAGNYTKGAIGIALSHLAIWDEAIDSDRIVTACEDDAIFHRRFSESAARVIAELPPDWDFILWGWNFDAELMFDMLPGVSAALCRFDQNRMRQEVRRFQEQAFAPKTFRLVRAFGIPCYSVSPKGARQLKDFCFPLRAMMVFFPGLNRQWPNNGIDIAMNDLYPRINAFVSLPPLVLTKNERSRSTVQTQS
jgi:GR25 family glycosyltransferase involved in LPS biosynthesis